MRKIKYALASTALITLLANTSAFAASDNDTSELRAEIQSMRQSYESRIADLEAKLSKMEKAKTTIQQIPVAAEPVQSLQPVTVARSSSGGSSDNSFNPAIGVILNGRYSNFSTDNL